MPQATLQPVTQTRQKADCSPPLNEVAVPPTQHILGEQLRSLTTARGFNLPCIPRGTSHGVQTINTQHLRDQRKLRDQSMTPPVSTDSYEISTLGGSGISAVDTALAIPSCSQTTAASPVKVHRINSPQRASPVRKHRDVSGTYAGSRIANEAGTHHQTYRSKTLVVTYTETDTNDRTENLFARYPLAGRLRVNFTLIRDPRNQPDGRGEKEQKYKNLVVD